MFLCLGYGLYQRVSSVVDDGDLGENELVYHYIFLYMI